MSTNEVKRCIFTDNRLWSLMYWDELREHRDWQITYCKGGNRPYLNSAHIPEEISWSALEEIEAFFAARQLPSRIYSNAGQESHFGRGLAERGYQLLPEEDEYCYEFRLRRQHEIKAWKSYGKLDQDLLYIREIDPWSEGLEDFLLINQEQNNLSPAMAAAFITKIRSQLTLDPNLSLQFFGLYYDEQLAAILTLGIVGPYAYLSEGACAARYTQRGLFSALVAYLICYCAKLGLAALYARCDRIAYSNNTLIKLGFAPFYYRSLWEKS